MRTRVFSAILATFFGLFVVNCSRLATPPEGAVEKEGVLEESAEQIEWEARVDRRLLDKPAFRFVQDVPALPRVLLIGDSISIGYTEAVRRFLAGKANVHRIPENGGDTNRGLQKLADWVGNGEWDVIHFNWGLHDIKYFKDGKLDLSGRQVSTIAEYERNLDELVRRLKETDAKLIWAATTPVPEGAQGRIKGDAARYDAVAAEIMKQHGVAINDLYAHVAPRLAELQQPANVHFTEEGSEFLGRQVAEAILEILMQPR